MIIEQRYVPLPPQQAFRSSTAKIRGYGGAMGGGKSRALCEEAFDVALDHPGCPVLLCRQAHTSIVNTTKATFFNEVMPIELLKHCKSKASAGEDYIELWNGSRIHFIGLDDPVRWFSAEVGFLGFDESHEISEDTVIRLMTRLRWRGGPNRAVFAFNPANPGHWLQKWFILGSSPTEHGYFKSELFPSNALAPIGDCEFVLAKATDNTHLPKGYVEQTLAGMPEHLRRRYLDGIWEFISGKNFFDAEALTAYIERVHEIKPFMVGDPYGEIGKQKIKVRSAKDGKMTVWVPPKRERYDDNLGKEIPAHRYVVGVDTSSGGAQDYSAIQVIDVEDFEQVAEWQGLIDPYEVAKHAFRIGRIYNDALVAPETTGGWGFTVVKELQRLGYRRIYTRPVIDRLTNKWTDKLGWDTTQKTRAHMLDTLERVIRDRELTLNGVRTLAELSSFVYPDKSDDKVDFGPPRAQPGSNDDLVIALAIAVTLATHLPRQLRRVRPDRHKPQFQVTGY